MDLAQAASTLATNELTLEELHGQPQFKQPGINKMLMPPEGLNTLEDYREQLARIGRRFLELHGDNPKVHDVFFYEYSSIDETITKKVNKAFELFASTTEKYLKTGIER